VAQEAAFAERASRERLAELERRREALAAQTAQQQGLLTQLTSERAAIDWTPVEEALQRQLAARGDAEQALAGARDRQEGLANDLRAADEARLTRRRSSSGAREMKRCLKNRQWRSPSSSSPTSSLRRTLTSTAGELRPSATSPRCPRSRACRAPSPSSAR
jgi:hypothetical protein